MFDKIIYEEIRNKIKEINKIKLVNDRINKTIEFKESIYSRIADEIDDLFSNINLKQNKNEKE